VNDRVFEHVVEPRFIILTIHKAMVPWGWCCCGCCCCHSFKDHRSLQGVGQNPRFTGNDSLAKVRSRIQPECGSGGPGASFENIGNSLDTGLPSSDQMFAR
jgi:hypothetical protein